jgi:molybdopterin-containing oxidoreductase family membrane subunit
MVGVPYLLFEGVGIWGLNNPVGWGWAIINFVWWIGIGHAGTLISAVLLLFRQRWRTSINRAAEAMTIFAVLCAVQFPLLHTGRPWLAAYWLLPYPNSMDMWPQFRSPLIWDVFAVSTYLTVSLVFWFVGLVPDFASMRDRTKNRIGQVIYGMLSLGWRGSAIHWERYEMASLLLAGLSTPLVLSVHSVVSFDFAVALIPGWHTTIFPPYFVAGAIYAGFAMVLTLMIPMRMLYGLEDFINERHLNNMAKVMLASGMIVAYGYFMEQLIAWYSASHYEGFMMQNRMYGPYSTYYWALIFCNIVVPQLLWFRYFRTSMFWLFFVCQFINVGMWLERFIIVVTSLHRDYMPSSWDMFHPTIWDVAIYVGTIGLFTVLFFLFIRGVPMISLHEIRTLLVSKDHK